MRSRIIKQLVVLVALVLPVPVAGAAGPLDPYFGEALYFAYQGQYFDALQRLDAEIEQHRRVDEPNLDAFYIHLADAEFSVGDFELNYRMHQRAGRAIKAVLEADVPDPIRNEAAYRLARIHFQKGQAEDALQVLDEMHGEVPDSVRDQAEFLRANIYMETGRSSEAVEVLRRLQGARDLRGFSAYNLGIALLQSDRPSEAIAQLDKAGTIRSADQKTLAIRDQSNLILGNLLFEAAEYRRSQSSLDRVRLEGPFSNRALLGAGWAAASAAQYERALVPWSVLAQRDSTDPAVQEALLALPFAYSKLDVHGRAAKLFEGAVETFGSELAKLDASIDSIREGAFLDALSREEIRQDADWVVKLRNLPNAPETFYLVDLMASHDFQTSLQNYLDLEDLRRRLARWQRGLDAFDEMTLIRRNYYEPLLPGLDARFRELDAQIRLRLEQRDQLQKRLDSLLIDPDPNMLATSAERLLGERLDRLEASIRSSDEAANEATRTRIARLRGALIWDLEMNYHQRLTDAHVHLTELTEAVTLMREQYDAFVRARQAATHSFEGYPPQIAGMRSRIARAKAECSRLMERQGQALEGIAIRELLARRNRLEDYQNQARFAFADSYDRAVKEQAQAH
jgi:hypothetical protein